MMLWKVGDEDAEKDEAEETVSGYANKCCSRTDVHGEDEVEDVWGRQVGASTAGRLVDLGGAHHHGVSELSLLNERLQQAIETEMAQNSAHDGQVGNSKQ